MTKLQLQSKKTGQSETTAKAEPLTKKKATRGRAVKLHKQYKRRAALTIDPHARRVILNLFLDMVAGEKDMKENARLNKARQETTKE